MCMFCHHVQRFSLTGYLMCLLPTGLTTVALPLPAGSQLATNGSKTSNGYAAAAVDRQL